MVPSAPFSTSAPKRSEATPTHPWIHSVAVRGQSIGGCWVIVFTRGATKHHGAAAAQITSCVVPFGARTLRQQSAAGVSLLRASAQVRPRLTQPESDGLRKDVLLMRLHASAPSGLRQRSISRSNPSSQSRSAWRHGTERLSVCNCNSWTIMITPTKAERMELERRILPRMSDGQVHP